MVDLAQHYKDGPVQLGEIAKRQNISVKYLEQLIIPLKKAHYINSIRGPKGGHMLARPPEKITAGEIVDVLERGLELTPCLMDPDGCDRAEECKTRDVWEIASRAMYEKLSSISLSEIIDCKKFQ